MAKWYEKGDEDFQGHRDKKRNRLNKKDEYRREARKKQEDRNANLNPRMDELDDD